jgi:hypothetical protein
VGSCEASHAPAFGLGSLRSDSEQQDFENEWTLDKGNWCIPWRSASGLGKLVAGGRLFKGKMSTGILPARFLGMAVVLRGERGVTGHSELPSIHESR